MAKVTTRLSDLIEPEVFESYTVQRSVETNLLYLSGIVVPDERLNQLAMGQGKTFNMPFFNDLGDDESNVGSDNPDSESTPKKIGTGQDVAVKHMRNQSWSSADLNQAVIGVDPMRVIGDLVAEYWNRQYQRILISSLTGVLADNDANDSDDMIYSVATDDAAAITDAECISGDAVVLAKQTMGDQGQKLVAIAMHSVPFSRLQRQNLIQTVRDPNSGRILFNTYLDLVVIVDDRCPAVQGDNRITYTSYLFGRGAIGMGMGKARVPVEIERNPAQGDGEGVEILYSRKHFILHPRGVKFVNTAVAGVSPTNTELEAAAQWDRVYDRKNVRIAFLKTNG
jgi:hypothetical protein